MCAAMNDAGRITNAVVTILISLDAAAVGNRERSSEFTSAVVGMVRRVVPTTGEDAIATSIAKLDSELSAGGARADLLIAVQTLRDLLSVDALRDLLADLVVFALQDDRFESEEARLISAIRRSWDVDSGEAVRAASANVSPDLRERLWSVLGSEGAAGTNWTPVHDLALVYISVAHRSDGELQRAEVDAITRKLAEWLPSALPSDVLNVVDEALRRYASGETHELLEQSIERVVSVVPVHQRPSVIRDLEYVAAADNVVLVEERQLIASLAERWGLQ